MGRYISQAQSVSGVFDVVAGVALTKKDLAAMASDGKVYPVKVTDLGAISAVGQAVAKTTYGSGGYASPDGRVPVLRDSDQNFYTVAPYSSGNGAKLFKYGPGGALIASVDANTSATGLTNARLFFLSNGNIALVYCLGATLYHKAIYTKDLIAVASTTSIESTLSWSSSGRMDAIPLSGGGYAISWQANSNPKWVRMAVYANDGSTVVAPTTVRTSDSPAGAWYQTTKLAQLTNGNIVLMTYDNSPSATSTAGLYIGIYNPTTLASVVALTRYNSTSSASMEAGDILVTASGFVASKIIDGSIYAWVFNNSGVQQGGTFSDASAVDSIFSQKLLFGDTTPWLLWDNGSNKQLSKLPLTGTGYTTLSLSGLTSQGNTAHDAVFREDNTTILMVTRKQVSDASPAQWSQFKVDGTVITQATNFAAGASAQNGLGSTVLLWSDFTWLCVTNDTSSAAQWFYVHKYSAASIIGVVTAGAVQNATASVAQQVGTYAVNALVGSTTKTFDHRASTVYGNQGVMMPYGIVLKGF